MTKTISITKEVEVTIDDDKLESMLKDFNAIMWDGTIDDIFMHIGWSIGTSDSSFVEGCGEDGKDFKIERNETIDTEIVNYD